MPTYYKHNVQNGWHRFFEAMMGWTDDACEGWMNDADLSRKWWMDNAESLRMVMVEKEVFWDIDK